MNICKIISSNFDKACVGSDVKDIFKQLTENNDQKQEDDDCVSNFSFEDKKSSLDSEGSLELEFDEVPILEFETFDNENHNKCHNCVDPKCVYIPQKPSPRVQVKSLFNEVDNQPKLRDLFQFNSNNKEEEDLPEIYAPSNPKEEKGNSYFIENMKMKEVNQHLSFRKSGPIFLSKSSNDLSKEEGES